MRTEVGKDYHRVMDAATCMLSEGWTLWKDDDE